MSESLQAVAFAAAMLPGKTHEERDALTSCASGERRADHDASRKRHGITREAVWIQSAPQGDIAGLHRGPRSPGRDGWPRHLAGSHRRLVSRAHQNVHGMDLTAPQAPPEQVLDYRG